jgi:arsenite/tail-anchored protein-transporting ATPase
LAVLLMIPLLAKPVLFFGGKGGVGKTTLAAAAALYCAEAGLRTLLVSTDPAHSAGDALELQLGPEARPVRPGLWALEIDPDEEAERHIGEVKERVREVAAPRLLQEVEREIDVARLSPGATEAALFERLAELMLLAGGEYDRVIFDTAPTGHTLRLLSLPELMTVWIEGLIRRRRRTNALARMWRNVAGAAAGGESPGDRVLEALEQRRDRFRAARARVTDPAITSFLFVILPERLPLLETRKAVQTLGRHRIPVGGVLVNRLLPENAEGAYLARRRDRETGYLQEIRASFPGQRLYCIPELDADVQGIPMLRQLLAASRPDW